MRPPLLAVLLLACLAGPLLAKPEAYRAGRIVSRTTKGGVVYAVYVPERWRKQEPLALVIHVPHAHGMPVDILEVPGVREEMRLQNLIKGHMAFHVTVLLKAHNQENATQKENIDHERFAALLARDAASVAEVIEEMSQEVRIQRDAIILRGSAYGAEVALGVAVRRPGLVAVLAMKDLSISARAQVGERTLWAPIPAEKELEKALELPIVLTWDPGEPNGEGRRVINHEVHDLLLERGFRRVDRVPGVPGDSDRKFMNPESIERCFKIVEGRRKRARQAAKRHAVLADARKDLARGKLAAALRKFVKARAQESAHDLSPRSRALLADLEREGRDLLKAADALSPAKRKAEYRKVARLFRGTQLAAEIQQRLQGSFPPASIVRSGEKQRFEPGKVVARTTSRGVQYAVYLPKRWNVKRALPMVLFVPEAHKMPEEDLARPRALTVCERWNAEGGGVIDCAVLFRSHNVLKYQAGGVDLARHPVLLDRDASDLDEVLAEVTAQVSIQPDAMAIHGIDYTAETALGIAVRRPQRFAAVLLSNASSVGCVASAEGSTWSALPLGDGLAPAFDLPVLYHVWLKRSDPRGIHARIKKYCDHLRRRGMRHVEFLGTDESRGLPGEGLFWETLHTRFFQIIAERRERAQWTEKRDRHLDRATQALEKGRLSGAVVDWVKARDLETMHGLDAASATVYARLEERGRTMIQEAKALSRSPRKPALRRVARVFKGTPIAEEARTALGDLR